MIHSITSKSQARDDRGFRASVGGKSEPLTGDRLCPAILAAGPGTCG